MQSLFVFVEVDMFDKLKQKFVKQAKSEAVQEIRRSSNEGRIRTVSAIVEGVIFVGLIIMSAKDLNRELQLSFRIQPSYLVNKEDYIYGYVRRFQKGS